MKRFSAGQKYIITSDARAIAIARVAEADGKRVTFEFSAGGKPRRHTARIRVARGSPVTEVAVLSYYDVIFAYNAI